MPTATRATAATATARSGPSQPPNRSWSGQIRPRSIAQAARSNGHLTASEALRIASSAPQTTRSSTAHAALARDERSRAGGWVCVGIDRF